MLNIRHASIDLLERSAISIFLVLGFYCDSFFLWISRRYTYVFNMVENLRVLLAEIFHCIFKEIPWYLLENWMTFYWWAILSKSHQIVEGMNPNWFGTCRTLWVREAHNAFWSTVKPLCSTDRCYWTKQNGVVTKTKKYIYIYI